MSSRVFRLLTGGYCLNPLFGLGINVDVNHVLFEGEIDYMVPVHLEFEFYLLRKNWILQLNIGRWTQV